MIKKHALAVSVVAALMVTVMAPAAQAEHSWNNYHWARTDNPLPLKVVDSVSSDWQFEFDTALAEWNRSAVIDMSVGSVDDRSRTRRRCSMAAGQMRVCNAAYGLNGWLGLATIGLDANGHIDRGSAQMNDSYASYWTDPNEKRHVMCQEIGHVFGLGHTSEDGISQQTCMDYSQDSNSISPNQHDYDLLRSIYLHQDSYNSYDDGDGSNGGGKCNPRKPTQCNKLTAPSGVPAGATRVARGPFSETWTMHRSDGGEWIFHVRLAPGSPGNN